jgi:putative transposase
MLILLATTSYRQARLQLLETRNRLHIYSRACCTSCGPRYQPLSRAPFTLRGIRLIHPPSFELACCRSDLFKASSTSRLTRKEKESLRNRYQRWRGHCRQQWNAADVVRVIPFLSGHDRLTCPPASRTRLKLVKSVNHPENDGHEEEQITEEQIIGFPAAGRGWPADQGTVAAMAAFSDATFYKWRAKFGGMQVSEAQRLRELESENAKLKRLLAEAHLDMHALKSVSGGKALAPQARREAVGRMVSEHHLSQRRACRLVGPLPRQLPPSTRDRNR